MDLLQILNESTKIKDILDSTVNVINIVIVIFILTIPIMAVIGIKRMIDEYLPISEDNLDYEEYKTYAEEEKVTRKSAMRILRERLANGEITEEEYTEKMARL